MKAGTIIAFGLLLMLYAVSVNAGWQSIVNEATRTATKETVKQISDAVSSDDDEADQGAAPEAAGPPDNDTLLARADVEIRAGERAMFNGQKQVASEHLANAASLLESVKQTDPEHVKLAPLQQKYARVKRDLDRRMGVTTSTAPSSAPEQSAPAPRTSSRTAGGAPAAAPAAAAQLPYHARQKMREFDNLMRSVDYSFRKMEEAKEGETTTPPEEYAKKIEEMTGQLQTLLDEAKEEAAKEGVTEHPDLAAAQEQLDAIPERLKQTSGEVAEVQAQRATAAADIATDVDAIRKEYERLREQIFNKAGGTVIYYNDLEPVKELIADIEDFEQNDKAQAEKLLQGFKEKYGATEKELEASLDDWQAANTAMQLQEGIINVAKTRTAMAEDLATKAERKIEGLADRHDFYRMQAHDEVREWVAMAQRFDAENTKVKEIAANVDKRLNDDFREFEIGLDDREWPSHAANAPDNADKLATTALDWFRNDPGWGQNPKGARTPLAVVVTGPWSIQARNILGEPTMYGLPIKLAVQLPEDKAKGLARVFILTMRTPEAKGVEMAPPFDSVTVGDSYFIRANAVK